MINSQCLRKLVDICSCTSVESRLLLKIQHSKLLRGDGKLLHFKLIVKNSISILFEGDIEGDSGKCYEFKKVAEGVGQAEAATACSKVVGGWKLIGEDALKSGNSE